MSTVLIFGAKDGLLLNRYFLKARLLPMRERFKAQEEREVVKMTKIKMGKDAKGATNGAAADTAAAGGDQTTRFSHSFPDDVGSNNSG